MREVNHISWANSANEVGIRGGKLRQRGVKFSQLSQPSPPPRLVFYFAPVSTRGKVIAFPGNNDTSASNFDSTRNGISDGAVEGNFSPKGNRMKELGGERDASTRELFSRHLRSFSFVSRSVRSFSFLVHSFHDITLCDSEDNKLGVITTSDWEIRECSCQGTAHCMANEEWMILENVRQYFTCTYVGWR